jgi:hypothetical protein
VSDGKVTNRAATAYYRCEVGETLQGGHCGLEAEAEFQGLLLCEWHVRQSEAYDRIGTSSLGKTQTWCGSCGTVEHMHPKNSTAPTKTCGKPHRWSVVTGSDAG